MGKVETGLRLAVLACLAGIALALAGMASAASVAPTFLPGASNDNKTCAANESQGESWVELKIDPPAAGTYTDGVLSVTISNVGSNGKGGGSFDWSSSIGVDAVIVKGGVDGGNLYRYNPPAPATGDTDLETPGNGFSHISFCYSPKLLVKKTAATSLTRTDEWTISKSAEPSKLDLKSGESGSTTWKIALDKTGSHDSDWAVAGDIDVTNPTGSPVLVAGVSDLVSGGISGAVDCGQQFPIWVPGKTTLHCTYTANLPNGDNRTNTATASTSAGSEVGGGSDTVPVDFANAAVTKVNSTVHVSDGNQHWTFSDDGSQSFEQSFSCDEDAGKHTNTATIDETEQSASASVTVTCASTPPPSNPPVTPTTPSSAIDLAVTKVDTPDPVSRNGKLTYTIVVTNKGPNPATNVVLADPLPASMTFVSVASSQGSCTGGALIDCALGSLASGASATVTVVVTAKQAGLFTNTATVTGEGGETNPADNTASAQTTVVAPLTPPTKKPKAKAKARAKPVACYTFSVTPKMISAGKSKTVVVIVRLAGKPVKGAKVVLRGAGILKSGRTNAQGRALIRVTARKPGILRVSVVSKASCATKRVGVVGAFEPPVTG